MANNAVKCASLPRALDDTLWVKPALGDRFHRVVKFCPATAIHLDRHAAATMSDLSGKRQFIELINGIQP
jgi:hypothetical protein